MADSPTEQTRAASPSPDPKRVRKRRIRLSLAYLAILVVDVSFSHWDELFGREQCNLVEARSWYQRVVTLGYRKPKPHFVRLVTVLPPQDACKYRLLLADLLDRIGKQQPIMIVLDYSFSPHDCGKATEILQSSIRSAASKAPVVFGIASSTLQEVEDRNKLELKPLKDAGFGPVDQAIWPSDIKADGSRTITGLYRLDCDSRRIAINWSVFDKKEGRWTRVAARVPTIAFAAASLYDPTLKNERKLTLPENPFTSFIPMEVFHPMDSTSIQNSNFEEWDFRWRIVVIGDALSDMHDSVVGRVPGVVLQANYIESLLDDRYFAGLTPASSAGAVLVCFLVIFAIFEKSTTTSIALFRAAFFLLLLVGTSYIALVHFARLFTFWAPCALAIPTGLLARLRT